MKKVFLVLICFLFCLTASCGKNLRVNAQNIENNVALELEKLDNNYSDETLKALSIVLRTNIYLSNQESKEKSKNEKYLSIAKSTKSKILSDKNNNIVQISLTNNKDYKWQKTIKKSKLLEFALKNGINLTNIKNITPDIYNDRVKGLNIGNKYFEYTKLAEEFKLESDQIENIFDNKTEIVISGSGQGVKNSFDLETSEQLSNNNQFFEEILAYFFEDLKIIYFNC